MNNSISIPIFPYAPFVTLDEFCKLSGHNINTAKKMVSDGRLPIRVKPVEQGRVKSKSKIEVNMVALMKEAAGFK